MTMFKKHELNETGLKMFKREKERRKERERMGGGGRERVLYE